MQKQLTNLLLIAVMAITTMSSLSAQKFGHINSQLLLIEMPAVKAADTEIETYQKQLLQKGQDMYKAFETKYLAYADKAQKGELNKIQMQQQESELTKEQQGLQAYELEVQNKLAQKREQLYKPILDKVKNAIEQLGKEEGYTMIFETGSGVLVHAVESEDLMSKVKARLGL